MTKDEMIQAVMDEFALDRKMINMIWALEECEILAKLGIMKQHGNIGSIISDKGREYLQRLKQVGYKPTPQEIHDTVEELKHEGIIK